MAIFPKVQSPCPYKSRLAEVMDGDMCGMCNRKVFDLSGMDDGERVAFMKGCAEEEVCVSYRFPVRAALAATLALAAVTAPMAAAAQSMPEDTDIMIIVGGISDPANVEFIEDPADSAIPVLPVVYEDTATEAVVPTEAAPATPAVDPAPVTTPVTARSAT